MIYPNIREVIDSLSGRSNKLFPNNKKSVGFQWFGLRQPDYTQPCGCIGVDGTREDPTCRRCMSTGYLFTDYLVKGYSWMGILGVEYNASPGLISTQQRNLVIEYNKPINKFDFVLELEHSPAGVLRQPFNIMRYFRVQDSLPLKGDDSRVEFWKCALEERNIESGTAQDIGTSFTYRGNRSNNEPE